MIRSSVAVVRGCYGGCAFCSLTAHEGRTVQSRSRAGIVQEIAELTEQPGFRGTITDLGGPSANMYATGCSRPEAQRVCRRPSCLHPTVCKNLSTDPTDAIELLRAVRQIPKVRHVLIASGIRHDLAERNPAYLREMALHHVGGQLSVAPEHVVDRVLERMRKPSIDSYERFAKMFEAESRSARKEQFLVPYFLTGHPGSTLQDAIALALWLKRRGLRPRQAQDFIPTPMSTATAMYYTGMDPSNGETIYVPRSLREKRMMKALALYWDEAQWPLVREALQKAKREDLIGRNAGCLVPPPSGSRHAKGAASAQESGAGAERGSGHTGGRAGGSGHTGGRAGGSGHTGRRADIDHGRRSRHSGRGRPPS